MPYLDVNRLRYAEFFDWYQGKLDTLFSNVAPTPVNGLTAVQPHEISSRFNYFAAISRFFGDAMLGDAPPMPPAARTLLETLTQHWAVTGECCLVRNGGRWTAVRPDYVHPIRNDYDRDVIDRFLFVYPERNRIREYPEFNNQTTYAERARVIDYDNATGSATVSIRQYRHGWVADLPTGEPTDIGGVIWIHTGDGVYHDCEGLVREISVRMNILQATLNSTSFSLLQVDKDSINDGVFLGGVNPEIVRQASRNGLGMTVVPPFIGEEGARYVERSGVGLEESLEYMRLLLGQLGVISGVPEYIFGVQLSQPSETERVLFAGQAKVNRFRRDIERAYRIAGWRIEFVNEPFVTRSERHQTIINAVEAGIVTPAEARPALNWGI